MERYVLVRERTVRTLEFYDAAGPNANLAKPTEDKPFETVLVSDSSTVASAVMEFDAANGEWFRRIVQHLGGVQALRNFLTELERRERGRCDE